MVTVETKCMKTQNSSLRIKDLTNEITMFSATIFSTYSNLKKNITFNIQLLNL